MIAVADWQALPLQGRGLVEASAGTGKTWTLSMLYLRLLLERELSPAQIVVGTFTDAAAQELRERIRSRLRWAQAQLRQPSDPAAQDEAGRWLHDLAGQRPQSALRLELAIAELDRAPIGTLHSLCGRILGEHPLQCASPLQNGRLISETRLHAELVDDLWRELSQGEQALDAADARLLVGGRAQLARDLRALDDDVELALPAPEQLAAIEQLREPGCADRLRALAARADLQAPRKRALINELDRLARCLQGADFERPEFKPAELRLDILAEGDGEQGRLAEQLHPQHIVTLRNDPDLRFAIAAARCLQQLPRLLRAIGLGRQIERLRMRREQVKRQRDLLTFSDLIERTHAALLAADSGLPELLYQRWPVALVDEFQDTDARQYAIFDRIYRDDDGAARGLLLLIGDPKQAIYRFRGGDIHTYQRAAAACAARLELDTNHRSSREMVAALNQLYALAGDGFRIAPGPGWFGYHPVRASTRRDGERYRIGDQPCARPLRLHRLPLQQTPATVAERRQQALDSCAETIAATLATGDHRIGQRPLQAGDIAVLLRTNEQVLELRRLLRERGVPCTGAGRSNVFSTDWARNLQILLWAILHPQDDGARRAALLTPLFGFDLDSLASLQADTAAWSAQIELFAGARRRWLRSGVLAALAPLLDAAMPRLLTDAEAGERALTDLRHLGELLAAADAEAASPEATWNWLAAQRADLADEAGDERQLRVESDRSRVQLLTLHASKGLEFGWVLLPLMWDHTGRDEEFPLLHDPQRQLRVLDLGGPDWNRHRELAAWEGLRERLRLLYVALTRAIHRCDLWVLDPGRASGGKPPAHPEAQASALDCLLQPLFANGNDLSASLPAIDCRDDWPQGSSRLREGEPAPAAAAEPLPMPAPRALDALVSFSSLTHGRTPEADRAEDESDPSEPDPDDSEAPHPELMLWERWRGSGLGNALHAILECRQIGVALNMQVDLIANALRAEGLPRELLEPAWIRRIAQRLDAVLDCELAPGLRLAALPASAQRAELDFRFRLDGASLAELRRVCERHGDARLLPPQVGSRQLHGLLSGKIDLVIEHAGVVHVLDYKSNRLGPRLRDYRDDALQRSMERSGYCFQALLYTVAVHRYLRQRLSDYQPQRHLGSAWYLYLRAAGLAPAIGVWRHRFPQPLIDAVDAVFAAGDSA